MRRPDEYSQTVWDDPLWQVARMVVDETRGRVLDSGAAIVALLKRLDTPASLGLLRYLRYHPELLDYLADYLAFRHEAATALFRATRTEDEALEDFRQMSSKIVGTYATRSADHHQSSRIMVATVEVITEDVCERAGLQVDVNPQKRATVISDTHIWTSPRRLDGALPSLLNPIGIWEIKEYWGGSGGGSKMSDAIYECQLVGQELRAFEATGGAAVEHYVILDGRHQWNTRMSDLRRAVDLLCVGLIDELIVGSEVLTEWPRIVREMCERVERPDLG